MDDPQPTLETITRAVLAPTTARPLAPGDVLGEWQIERQIGEGGMGTVYAAVHTQIGKHAALKVIRARIAEEPHVAERFLQEARIVNQIQHPNIVDIFQLGRIDDGRPYLVMELLHGESLGERLDQGRVPALEAIDILLQICAALGAAHACGVVHRDLKPDNIFLAGPLTKLLDWGIAKMIDRPWGAVDQTGAGSLVGTPRYVAPEQARGLEVDARTDLYSLGCIAHEVFLESPPFAADNVADLLVAHLHEPVAPPSDVWPDIPLVLERMILGMLEKDADRRMSLPTIVESLRLARLELDARANVSTGQLALVVHRPVSGTDATLMSGTVETPRRRWPARVAMAVALAGTLVAGYGFTVDEPLGRATAMTLAPGRPRLAEVAPIPAEAPAPIVTPVLVPVVVAPAARSKPHRKAAPRRIQRDATIDPFADE